MIPVAPDLVTLCARASRVAVIEDGLEVGGIGSQLSTALRANDIDVPVRTFGVPRAFLDHASRGQVLEVIGLTPDTVANALI